MSLVNGFLTLKIKTVHFRLSDRPVQYRIQLYLYTLYECAFMLILCQFDVSFWRRWYQWHTWHPNSNVWASDQIPTIHFWVWNSIAPYSLVYIQNRTELQYAVRSTEYASRPCLTVLSRDLAEAVQLYVQIQVDPRTLTSSCSLVGRAWILCILVTYYSWM